MKIEDRISIVSRIQNVSFIVYSSVIHSLEAGMSETDISELIRCEFEKHGVSDYWYTIPRQVSIGVERFIIATATAEYARKHPVDYVKLNQGTPVYIDMSPVDPVTKLWGDWARLAVFKPQRIKNHEQIAFLQEFRKIQLDAITKITANSTGCAIITFFLNEFRQRDITLLDSRNSVGHSMHRGEKQRARRVWINLENTKPLGSGIYTIEPGGIRLSKRDEKMLIARFEETIYIPQQGFARILGNTNELPFAV